MSDKLIPITSKGKSSMTTITEYSFEVSLDTLEKDGSITTYSGNEWAESAYGAINLRCQRHDINPAALRRVTADWHDGRAERTIQCNS